MFYNAAKGYFSVGYFKSSAGWAITLTLKLSQYRSHHSGILIASFVSLLLRLYRRIIIIFGISILLIVHRIGALVLSFINSIVQYVDANFLQCIISIGASSRATRVANVLRTLQYKRDH